jgi:uncharacterized membrane protein YkoI
VRLLVVAAVLGAAAQTALAAERVTCLTPDERRAAIAEHRAVPLGSVLHLVRTRVFGEVVKARLCRGDAGKELVYVLTVLARNGKVLQARVDATDGHWLGAS